MTGHAHPLSCELLDAFFAGEVSAYDLLEVALDHLEEECPDCRDRLAQTGVDLREAIARAGSEARATAADLQRERHEACGLVEDLDRLDRNEAILRVVGDPRLRTTALVEALLDRAREHLERRTGARADRDVMLAHLVAQVLDAGRYGAEAIRSLKVETWLLQSLLALERGAVDRAASDLGDAGGLLAPTRDRPAHRPSDHLRSGLALGLARLRIARGRTDRARRLLEAACRRDGEDRGPWSWSLRAELARLRRAAGSPGEAAALLRTLPVPPQGPTQWRCGHELVLALVEDGRGDEAAETLERWERTAGGATGTGTAGSHPELELLRGTLLRRSGSAAEAERLLRRSRARFVFLERGVEAARASLELLRLALTEPDDGGTLHAAGDLDGLAACPDLTGEDLAELACCAGAAWRGTLASDQIDLVQSRIESGIPARRPSRPPLRLEPGIETGPDATPETSR